MPVYMAFHMEQLTSDWTEFCEIWYLRIFRTYVEKIQVSLKSDNNNVYFTRIFMSAYDNISLSCS
jgi:hypothetical protein